MKRNTRSEPKEEVCDMTPQAEPEPEEVVLPPRRDIQWTVSLERWRGVIYGILLLSAFMLGAGCTHILESCIPALIKLLQKDHNGV